MTRLFLFLALVAVASIYTSSAAANEFLSLNTVSCHLGFFFRTNRRPNQLAFNTNDIGNKVASVLSVDRSRISLEKIDKNYEYKANIVYIKFRISKPRYVSQLARDNMALNVNRFVANANAGSQSTRSQNQFSSGGQTILPFGAAATGRIKLAEFIGDLCTQLNYCPQSNAECIKDQYDDDVKRCECRPGTVDVGRKFCYDKVNSSAEIRCKACEDSEGTCYRTETGTIGCKCPFWRGKTSPASLKCSIEYMKLFCRESEMTVCLRFDKLLTQIGIGTTGNQTGTGGGTIITTRRPLPTIPWHTSSPTGGGGSAGGTTSRATVGPGRTTTSPDKPTPTTSSCKNKIGVDTTINKERCNATGTGESVDLTQEPCNQGCDVVAAVITKINKMQAFTNDRLFLRRIAYAETRNGRQFCVKGGRYGMWAVTPSDLSSSQTNSRLVGVREKIRSFLKIDWSQVETSDLTKPLYSALTAYMKVEASQQSIPPSVSGQANLWKQIYNRNTNQTAQDFINADRDMKAECNCKQVSGGADIIFVVDESGSVGSAGFTQSMRFIKEIVKNYNSNGWNTKFSILMFSSSSRIAIKFSDYSSTSALLTAIDNIRYNDGGTDTASAIRLMTDAAFLTSNGARPKTAGVAKVALLITDGQSNSYTATCQQAQRARNSGISIIGIGVGSGVNQREMECMVGPANLDKIYDVTNYNNIQYIEDEIQTVSCETSVDIVDSDKIQGQMEVEEKKFFKKQVDTTVGTQVTFTADSGEAVVYMGRFPNPSPALHDWKARATPGAPAVINITPEKLQMLNESGGLLLYQGRRSTSTLNVFGTVIAQKNNTDFSLVVTDQPEDESCLFHKVTGFSQGLCGPGEHRLNLPFENATDMMRCGTVKSKITDEPARTAYTNRITIQQSNLFTTKFDVVCEYQNQATIGGHAAITTRAELLPSKKIYKSATIKMRLLDKDAFELKNNATVRYGDKIKLEMAMVDNKNAFRAIKVESCKVSGTNDFERSKPLVRNSCVVPGQPYMKPESAFKRVANDPAHLQTEPGIDMFRLEGSWSLFFRCKVKLCQFVDECKSTTCGSGSDEYESFGKRRRRRDASLAEVDLTYSLQAEQDSIPNPKPDTKEQQEKPSGGEGLVASVAIGGGCLVLVALIAVGVIFGLKRHSNNTATAGKPTLPSRRDLGHTNQAMDPDTTPEKSPAKF